MKPAQFRALVEEALQEIPAEFRPWLEGVAIVIEPLADGELLDAMEIEDPYELLGLYEGVPLTEREEGSGGFDWPAPERIRLFREALLARAGEDPQALREEIQITLIHEIGHHFGLDEDRIEDLGFG